MASTSSSSGLWDPCKVLKVNPWNPQNSTCVGHAPSTGKRCGWHFDSEKLTPTQTDNAIRSLITISGMHPSMINYSTLVVLAQDTLCYWHGNQADRICAEWKAAIQEYLPEHSQRLAAVTAVKQESYGARDVKPLQNGSAKDGDTSELEKSEARCSALLAKNSKLDRQREEVQASTSQILDSLKQLKDDQIEQRALGEQTIKKAEQLTKLLAEKNDEIENLRSQLISRNANFQNNLAASSKEISRLEARIKELEALNRNLADLVAACSKEISRLEARVKKLEALNRKLADGRDEDKDNVAASSKEISKLEARIKELEALNRNLADVRDEDENNLVANSKKISRLEARIKELEALNRNLADARDENNLVASSKEISRLEARIKELEALNRNLADGRTEDATHISRLREQDRKVEFLTKRMDAVRRELEEREDELSSLQPRNAKRGVCAVISWWPPRIVVRKMGRGMMKRGSGSYVQSGV